MFNMDEDQMVLQTPLMDMDQDGQTISPGETQDNLNLLRVKMMPPHFCL